MTEAESPPPAREPSGSAPGFRGFARHGRRVAAGVVFAAALLEWLVGGLTASGALEFYVFAWASLTAAVWFLFDRAERTVSEEVRARTASWLLETDPAAALGGVPEHFVALFDRIFGERHFTLRCFWRSTVASFVTVAILTAFYFATGGRFEGLDADAEAWRIGIGAGLLLGFATGIVNVLPDYLSLLQTRFMLRRAARRGEDGAGRGLAVLLGIDAVLTGAIAFGAAYGILTTLWWGPDYAQRVASTVPHLGAFLVDIVTMAPQVRLQAGDVSYAMSNVPLGIFFYSTFLTSVWLWLYALSVPLSRVLVRAGRGMGFLLRAADVSRHPFQALGFASVLVVSALFLCGLPLLLLV
ncbi:MAG: hypothetical protein RH859_12515 [Longimicrobiales bacterium]